MPLPKPDARMMSRRRSTQSFALAVLAVALLTSAATAQQQPSNQAAPDQPSDSAAATIWQFGEHDKLCLEWTDGCRRCRRTGDSAVGCSNIGIACQPAEPHCTVRDNDKK